MPLKVAEIVTVHRLESQPLIDGLKRDEALIHQSAATMQASMNRMAVSTDTADVAAINATQSFTLMAAQASFLGGPIGIAAGRMATFAGSIASVGKAALGIPGLILAVGTAIGFLVNRFTQQARAAKEAREEFERYTKTLQDESASASKSIDDMARKVLMGRAGQRSPEAVLRQQQQFEEVDLQRKANEAYARRQELFETAYALEHFTEPTERQAAQLEEVNVLIQATREKEALVSELILQSRTKLQDDVAKLTQERLRKEVEAEKRAAEERKQAYDITPLGRIVAAIEAEFDAMMMRQQVESIFGAIAGILPDDLRKAIEGRLRIGGEPQPVLAGVGRTRFAGGAFTDIGGAGGQMFGGFSDVERRKERRDELRNETLRDMRDLLIFLATAKRKDVVQ